MEVTARAFERELGREGGRGRWDGNGNRNRNRNRNTSIAFGTLRGGREASDRRETQPRNGRRAFGRVLGPDLAPGPWSSALTSTYVRTTVKRESWRETINTPKQEVE